MAKLDDFHLRAQAERERTRLRPKRGHTVAVFLNGSTHPDQLRSGKVIRVLEDGWTVDVELNPRPGKPNAIILGCTFAPARALAEGEQRPAKSWDFIV